MMRRRRPFGFKGQFEMTDDPVDNLMEQEKAAKTRYSWHASGKSQAIFVRMSSDVDDETSILTTIGDGKSLRELNFSPSIKCEGPWEPDPDVDILFAESVRRYKIPKDTELTVRTFKDMQIKLNGKRIRPLSERTNWKRRSVVNLRPFLRTGKNTCIIQVSNPQGIPALLVESPAYLRTRSGRKAALISTPKNFRPVVSPMKLASKSGPLQKWGCWKWIKWIVLLWLGGAVIIGLYK